MARGIAVVAGSTGLVGRAVLTLLGASNNWLQVRALTRRPFSEPLAPTITPVVVDFDQSALKLPLTGATHLFSCLGTTMKQAGSGTAFRRVDLDIPLMIARMAREHGAQHALLVSAVGASSRSRVFYSQVKGEMEDALLSLEYRSVTIVRPSFLVGERASPRLGERIASVVLRLVPARWAPVQADQVARAMVAAAARDTPGVEILENPVLRRS